MTGPFPLFLAHLPLLPPDFPMTDRRPNRGIAKPSKTAFRKGKVPKFYGIRNGRSNFSGVLANWEDCKPYVVGVPGVAYKSFPTHEEALSFSSVAMTSPKRQRKKFYAIRNGIGSYCGVVTSWEECSLYVKGVSGVKFKGFADYEEAREFAETETPAEADSAQTAEEVAPVVLAPVPIVEDAEKFMSLVVYTDGACSKNGQCGSRAGYGVYFGDASPFNISEPLNGHATNQRAEMTAVLAAIRTVLANELVLPEGRLEIRTDSQYTKNGMDKWVDAWKKNEWKTAQGTDVKNKDLWVALDQAKLELISKIRYFSLVWVKGHVGNVGNEAADGLAVAGIDKLNQL